MELLILIFIVWVIVAIARGGSSAPPPSSGTRPSSSSEPGPQVRTKAPPPNTFRPSSNRSTKTINFGARTAQVRGGGDLQDINDAFTGRRLDLSQPVFECTNCHVFYQAASMAVLREANSSRCMACGSTSIDAHGESAPYAEARNYTPDAITLDNYRSHIGHVVTFRGHVDEVLQSRRGHDYAVMFEQKSWTKGLKMVAFKGGVRKLGGGSKLRSYKGRIISIRGLLIMDRTFGPQIIVDDPAMIVSVE